jgi:hypothetical protein
MIKYTEVESYDIVSLVAELNAAIGPKGTAWDWGNTHKTQIEVRLFDGYEDQEQATRAVIDAHISTAGELARAITAAKREWHTTLNQFIAYKPNGDFRYTGSFKENALNAKIEAVRAGASVPALISTAEAWIQRVKQEYWTVKAQIEASATLRALAGIDISYEGLEAQFGVSGSVMADPDVSSKGL